MLFRSLVLVGGRYTGNIYAAADVTMPVYNIGAEIVGTVNVSSPDLYSYVLQNGAGTGIVLNIGKVESLVPGPNLAGYVVQQGNFYASLDSSATETSLIRLNGADQTTINANAKALTIENASTQTTVGAAGGASSLPATPLGYLRISVDGGTTVVKVPYYTS